MSSKIVVTTSNTPELIIRNGVFNDGQIVTIEEHKAALDHFYNEKDIDNFFAVEKAVKEGEPFHWINYKGFTLNGTNFPAGMHFTINHCSYYWTLRCEDTKHHLADFPTIYKAYTSCHLMQQPALAAMNYGELRELTKVARMHVEY